MSFTKNKTQSVIWSPFLLYATTFLSFLFHLVKSVTGKPSLQGCPSSIIAPFLGVLTRMLINLYHEGAPISRELSLIQVYFLAHLNPTPLASIPLHSRLAPASTYWVNLLPSENLFFLININTATAGLCCKLTLVLDWLPVGDLEIDSKGEKRCLARQWSLHQWTLLSSLTCRSLLTQHPQTQPQSYFTDLAGNVA